MEYTTKNWGENNNIILFMNRKKLKYVTNEGEETKYDLKKFKINK